MITLDGNPQGTGSIAFGPDTVLTNYHVMEPVLDGDKKPTDVECVFDFKKLPKGDPTRTPVKLHATDWQIDHSPYSKAAGYGEAGSDRPV